MRQKLSWILLGCLIYLSCNKQGDQNPPPAPPTSNMPDTSKTDSSIITDSVFLLKSIRSNSNYGDDFDFTYDERNKLTKISKRYNSQYNLNFYINYANGKVSHVVSESEIYHEKASFILLYGINSKCSKVVYKEVFSTDINSNYFTNLTDGRIKGYDTLLYNADNQLIEIISYKYQQKNVVARFSYRTSADSLAYRIEYDEYTGGNISGSDLLVITTNNLDNPACKLVWYCPFLTKLGYITDNFSWVSLPLLFDDPSSNADVFLPFISKCVTNYKVYNNWGLENYTNSSFRYTYSSDSLRLHADNQITPSSVVNYDFVKRRKR